MRAEINERVSKLENEICELRLELERSEQQTIVDRPINLPPILGDKTKSEVVFNFEIPQATDLFNNNSQRYSHLFYCSNVSLNHFIEKFYFNLNRFLGTLVNVC